MKRNSIRHSGSRKEVAARTASASSGSVPRIVSPLVECHHCKGSGKLPLSEEMLLTLDAVKWPDPGDGATAQEVATALLWDGHISAINNRLEWLRRHGFLRRERHGKRWTYWANEKAYRPA